MHTKLDACLINVCIDWNHVDVFFGSLFSLLFVYLVRCDIGCVCFSASLLPRPLHFCALDHSDDVRKGTYLRIIGMRVVCGYNMFGYICHMYVYTHRMGGMPQGRPKGSMTECMHGLMW
jgi:hypothetical protein